MPSNRRIAKIVLVIVTATTVCTFPIDSRAQEKIGNCGNNLATLQDAKLDVLSELTIDDNLEGKFRISFLDISISNVSSETAEFKINNCNGWKDLIPLAGI